MDVHDSRAAERMEAWSALRNLDVARTHVMRYMTALEQARVDIARLARALDDDDTAGQPDPYSLVGRDVLKGLFDLPAAMALQSVAHALALADIYRGERIVEGGMSAAAAERTDR
jgi:hypothetical protein